MLQHLGSYTLRIRCIRHRMIGTSSLKGCYDTFWQRTLKANAILFYTRRLVFINSLSVIFLVKHELSAKKVVVEGQTFQFCHRPS